MPEAISGSGGHDALFAVASVLIHGFDLPEADAWQILIEYNARCQPPWSEKELKHKAAQTGKVKHGKPRGYLLDPALGEQRAEPDWDLADKPIASGEISTTFTTLNSHLYARDACTDTTKPRALHN